MTEAATASGEIMLDLGGGLQIWRMDIDDLREQDVNARVMSAEAFGRLTATIGRDQRLESLPLCAKTKRGVEIVSGHHRVRACRAAGMREIPVIVDISGLTPSQIKAKQLAHNAIQGEDNAQLVAQIYAEIDDVDSRLEAFVDEETYRQELARLPVTSIDVTMETRSALLTFLPLERAVFDRALDEIGAQVDPTIDAVYVDSLAHLEDWKRAISRIGTEYDVKSVATTVATMAELALKQLGEEPDVDPESWVPLRDIFGAGFVPPEAAEVMRAAIARMREKKELSGASSWKAIEYWAADYLGG